MNFLNEDDTNISFLVELLKHIEGSIVLVCWILVGVKPGRGFWDRGSGAI